MDLVKKKLRLKFEPVVKSSYCHIEWYLKFFESHPGVLLCVVLYGCMTQCDKNKKTQNASFSLRW